MDTTTESAWLGRARDACDAAVRTLRERRITTESLADLIPEGRRLRVFPRPATMRPLGEVWRLGALLLDTSGGLYATGRMTRAAERGRVGYQSLSREARRDIAAAALRGGYPVGATVNFDAIRLPLDAASITRLGPEAPVGFADGELRVRWRAGAPLDGAPSLAEYLAERVELLVHPPFSAP